MSIFGENRTHVKNKETRLRFFNIKEWNFLQKQEAEELKPYKKTSPRQKKYSNKTDVDPTVSVIPTITLLKSSKDVFDERSEPTLRARFHVAMLCRDDIDKGIPGQQLYHSKIHQSDDFLLAKYLFQLMGIKIQHEPAVTRS